MNIRDLLFCDVAIDLGTTSTLVYKRGRGIILREPSMVAYEENGKVLCVGAEAAAMVGRTSRGVKSCQPLKDGVITDIDMTTEMLEKFLEKVIVNGLRYTRAVICVPGKVSSIEKRAVEEAARMAGARYVSLMEEPLAAAIGAGLPVGRPMGSMVVDIGGGSTDTAVVSLGGIVVCNSLRCGGRHMDEAIISHVLKQHDLVIGESAAEELKKQLACAMQPLDKSCEVRGRSKTTGLPQMAVIHSKEVCYAIGECVDKIAESVRSALECVPPEIAGDLMDTGITLTGGGALLPCLDILLERITGLEVYVAEAPLDCVALGAGKSLERRRKFSVESYAPKAGTPIQLNAQSGGGE